MLLIALLCAAVAAGVGFALLAGYDPGPLRFAHAVLGVAALVLVLTLTVPDEQWRLRGLAAGALLLATASGSKLFHRRIKKLPLPLWARLAHAGLGLVALGALAWLAQLLA
ncbi:hypothetical protein GYB61_07020 [bacterium]|nr:hypothetical protein [bacterium]